MGLEWRPLLIPAGFVYNWKGWCPVIRKLSMQTHPDDACEGSTRYVFYWMIIGNFMPNIHKLTWPELSMVPLEWRSYGRLASADILTHRNTRHVLTTTITTHVRPSATKTLPGHIQDTEGFERSRRRVGDEQLESRASSDWLVHFALRAELPWPHVLSRIYWHNSHPDGFQILFSNDYLSCWKNILVEAHQSELGEY